MKKYWLSIFLIAGTILTYGQGIIINADGTHSIGINSGNPGVIVNANGTYSTVINSGTNISTVVNPNGTYSTLINNGSIATIVNPDGTQSVGINNGTTIQVITPDPKNARNNNREEETPSETVFWFNLPDEDEVAPVSKSVRKHRKMRNEQPYKND